MIWECFFRGEELQPPSAAHKRIDMVSPSSTFSFPQYGPTVMRGSDTSAVYDASLDPMVPSAQGCSFKIYSSSFDLLDQTFVQISVAKTTW